ncbi:MAG: YidC/Oxa1 family membrane protein insertase [Ruminococcus sp.]|jgi:YidC/Oxa1 family membrane protein insertase|nr:YidC/Oxa1 family membrane protein insertase [Ruminococcus sp.]
MIQIFGFFGSILGYLLWGLFYVFQNFGVSIIFFTIIIKFIIFPFSIKQQKSMASTSRLQKKQKEIREKYANNKQKANEEMQKLYEKEGVSPTGGCLTSIVPMLIMLGIFYSVAYPLTNTLHINSSVVENAISYINSIPGFAFNAGVGMGRTYQEINLVKGLAESNQLVSQLFNSTDAANVQMFVNGFNFAGFNLLTTPSEEGFFSVYILVPVLCFLSSIGAQVVTMRINGTGQSQQGCMKVMMYVLPLFSAWIAYSVPAAVGFYWICSSLFSLVQSIIMGKFYGPTALIAKSEAQHVALLEMQEAKVEYNYAPASFDNKKKTKKK